MDSEFNDNQSNQESPVSDMDVSAIETATLTLLRAIGENPEREGLKNTPNACGAHVS